MIEVAAGLVFREGRLLITQRHADDYLGGLWEFPGGKREGAESGEECLRRALREELGIEIEILERIAIVQHTYPEKSVQLHFYRCAWRGGEPQALDCQAFAWIEAAELGQYPFPPADARLLKQLADTPQWWQPVGSGRFNV